MTIKNRMVISGCLILLLIGVATTASFVASDSVTNILSDPSRRSVLSHSSIVETPKAFFDVAANLVNLSGCSSRKECQTLRSQTKDSVAVLKALTTEGGRPDHRGDSLTVAIERLISLHHEVFILAEKRLQTQAIAVTIRKNLSDHMQGLGQPVGGDTGRQEETPAATEPSSIHGAPQPDNPDPTSQKHSRTASGHSDQWRLNLLTLSRSLFTVRSKSELDAMAKKISACLKDVEATLTQASISNDD